MKDKPDIVGKPDVVDSIAAATAAEWWRQEIINIHEPFWELQPEGRKQQWRQAIRAGLKVMKAMAEDSVARFQIESGELPSHVLTKVILINWLNEILSADVGKGEDLYA
jgi:hypothetical protein